MAGGYPAAADFAPRAPLSVLIIHGTADPLVHYAGGPITLPRGRQRAGVLGVIETARLWAAHNGAELPPIVEPVADAASDDGCRVQRIRHPGGRDGTDVVIYRLDGGGHTWPGGIQYLPARVVGRVCRNIDATSVIWDFFAAHPRPSAAVHAASRSEDP